MDDIKFEPFNDLYKITKEGKVYSVLSKDFLKSHLRNGYLAVCLYNGKTKDKKTVHIHRLMGLSYLGVKKGEVINHEDGDKTNNNLSNLKVVSYKENTKHAIENKLTVHPTVKVQKIAKDKNGNEVIIECFDSIKEAAANIVLKSNGKYTSEDSMGKHISAVCLGKRTTAGGYQWKYENDNREIPTDFTNYKPFPKNDNYLISDEGKVFSKRANKILIAKENNAGYLSVKIPVDGKNTDFYVHRLVAELFILNPDNKKYVNHKNSVKNDNKLSNLEWVTNQENTNHAYATNNFAFTKKIICTDINTNTSKEYNSIKDLANDLKIGYSGLCKLIKNNKIVKEKYKIEYSPEEPSV
jgi:hypothetical protein